MMLSQNDVSYVAVSDDAWMPAHQLLSTSLSSDAGNVTVEFWGGDYDLNLMACIDQYQFCNPNKAANDATACTKLSGQSPVLAELDGPGGGIGLNPYQIAAAMTIMANALTQSMYYSVNGRGASALNGTVLPFIPSATVFLPSQPPLNPR
jgi:hypothetical protein